MKVTYRGFEGELKVNLSTDTYDISAYDCYGRGVFCEDDAKGGHGIDIPMMLARFKKAVDASVDGEGR